MIECGWRGGRGLGWGRAPPRAAHPGPSLGSPTSATVQLQVDCLLFTGRNLTLITPCHNKLVQHFNVQNNCNHKIPLNYLQLPAACHACCAVVVFYYHCMWTCEQSAVTAVSRPRPRLQHRQVLTAASVCGRRETPGARQSGQPLSWVLPRMRTPRSLHNLGWRGHWPPTGAVYSLCRSVTQFLVITASNGACTCMQPCPGRLLLKTVMVSNDIMNWIHSNMQQFWNQHTSIFIVSFFLNFYSNYILILKMHVKVGLFIC